MPLYIRSQLPTNNYHFKYSKKLCHLEKSMKRRVEIFPFYWYVDLFNQPKQKRLRGFNEKLEIVQLEKFKQKMAKEEKEAIRKEKKLLKKNRQKAQKKEKNENEGGKNDTF